jgi:hypothetical protein
MNEKDLELLYEMYLCWKNRHKSDADAQFDLLFEAVEKRMKELHTEIEVLTAIINENK